MTFRQNLAKVPAAFAYASSEMRKAGVQIHELSEDQIAAFRELAGHQRPEWDEWKVKLAGSMENFEKMLEASQTQGDFFVHNV